MSGPRGACRARRARRRAPALGKTNRGAQKSTWSLPHSTCPGALDLCGRPNRGVSEMPQPHGASGDGTAMSRGTLGQALGPGKGDDRASLKRAWTPVNGPTRAPRGEPWAQGRRRGPGALPAGPEAPLSSETTVQWTARCRE